MAEISVKSSNDNQAVDSSESNNANIKSNERPFLFGVHFKLLRNPDPAIPRTMVAIAVNFILSHILIYGITGNPRAAFLGGTLTIPVAGFTAVKEANQDYERWKVLRVLKIRDDMPDDQLPYRTRHDWTEFDRYLREHQLLK
ncbi:unnamed protein product [Dracunculus medinensis]|uniref:Transmembrane protein n=1 Tax=Dracunculus medinensis TaxID=318479 RepID=A0A0N4UCL6_DRAME|nr:unnamed protein product [Dracunculus medinensis]